ncbi:hypothetical protein [Trinickia sp.]|uniref:hypothetical protein n=1 Tax=Trinickia sp. TaxID=2571163 RepID=UPI003F81E371
MTNETNGTGWPVNDIGGLAREVPEVDPRRYFDEQARVAYEEALVKWPVLARLMGLVDEEGNEQPPVTATPQTASHSLKA